jgi:hypothetical protein
MFIHSFFLILKLKFSYICVAGIWAMSEAEPRAAKLRKLDDFR